ncbi:hypothetical protein BYT27DRAFT_6952427 [Phlegmacium glaucopus]|nr:hypothetical protein BYT27DRAFT_6952427 [Phlegmacium glaucopus]
MHFAAISILDSGFSLDSGFLESWKPRNPETLMLDTTIVTITRYEISLDPEQVSRKLGTGRILVSIRMIQVSTSFCSVSLVARVEKPVETIFL